MNALKEALVMEDNARPKRQDALMLLDVEKENHALTESVKKLRQ
jgi:hypothetical protein